MKPVVQEEDLISIYNSGQEQPAMEGAVEAVRIVRDNHSRIGKGIAYVLFRTKVAALAALQLNGSDCKGRAMRVMRVEKSSPSTKATGAAGRLKNSKDATGRSKNSKDAKGHTKKQLSAGKLYRLHQCCKCASCS